MDTIKKGRFSTFDKTFEKPKKYDLVIKKRIKQRKLKSIVKDIIIKTV